MNKLDFEIAAYPGTWGPHFWKVIHILCLVADMESEGESKDYTRANNTIECINSLVPLLFCNPCSDHFKHYLKNHPIPTEKMFEWSHEFHNAVSIANGTRPISLEDAIAATKVFMLNEEEEGPVARIHKDRVADMNYINELRHKLGYPIEYIDYCKENDLWIATTINGYQIGLGAVSTETVSVNISTSTIAAIEDPFVFMVDKSGVIFVYKYDPSLSSKDSKDDTPLEKCFDAPFDRITGYVNDSDTKKQILIIPPEPSFIRTSSVEMQVPIEKSKKSKSKSKSKNKKNKDDEITYETRKVYNLMLAYDDGRVSIFSYDPSLKSCVLVKETHYSGRIQAISDNGLLVSSYYEDPKREESGSCISWNFSPRIYLADCEITCINGTPDDYVFGTIVGDVVRMSEIEQVDMIPAGKADSSTRAVSLYDDRIVYLSTLGRVYGAFTERTSAVILKLDKENRLFLGENRWGYEREDMELETDDEDEEGDDDLEYVDEDEEEEEEEEEDN